MSRDALIALKKRYEKAYLECGDDTPRQIAAWLSYRRGIEIINAILEEEA